MKNFPGRFVEFCGQAAPKDEDTPEKRWPASYWWAPAGSSSSAVGKLCIPPAPSPEVLMKNREKPEASRCVHQVLHGTSQKESQTAPLCVSLTCTSHGRSMKLTAHGSKSIGFVTFPFTIAAVSTGVGQWWTSQITSNFLAKKTEKTQINVDKPSCFSCISWYFMWFLVFLTAHSLRPALDQSFRAIIEIGAHIFDSPPRGGVFGVRDHHQTVTHTWKRSTFSRWKNGKNDGHHDKWWETWWENDDQLW